MEKGKKLLNSKDLLSESDIFKGNVNMLLLRAKNVTDNYFNKEDVDDNIIYDDMYSLKQTIQKLSNVREDLIPCFEDAICDHCKNIATTVLCMCDNCEKSIHG